MKTTRLGLGILCAAAVLGVLGDGLLRGTPWGLNILILAGVLALAIIVLDRELAGARHPHPLPLLLPTLAFAAAVAWRDSETLKALNVLGAVASLVFLTLGFDLKRLRIATFFDYLVATGGAVLHACLGPILVVASDVDWKDIRTDGWSRTALAIARGAILAFPLVLVFGALLVSADVAFERLVSSVFDFGLEDLIGHVVLASFLSWLACGYLRSVVSEIPDAVRTLTRPSFLSLGFVEVAIVLGALDALFGVFVGVQIPYLFGGESYAKATVGLTYAQYYRNGFFELVAVATLVLPLQLVLHWLLRRDNPIHERGFRWLAGIQLALVTVIMVSALQRLRVYVAGYGLTELRLYTTAFLAWVAIVFVWFTATVLAGRRERFATGAVVSALATLLALNALNPDALIVRTNIALSRGDGTFDADYATSLSADAVPTLVEALPALGYHDRCDAARGLRRRWEGVELTDLRSWSASRWVALRSLDTNRDALAAAECGTLPPKATSIVAAPTGR